MQDQIWWVTGASSGIGAALAKALAARGAKLILSGRNVAALDAVAADCGGEALVLPFEATDYAALPAVADRAWAWQGRIDGLVNNAGISQRSLAIENGLSPDDAAAQMLAAVDAGTRELVVAEGAEAAIAALRRDDPDALFDRMSEMVQAGYAQQMSADRTTRA